MIKKYFIIIFAMIMLIIITLYFMSYNRVPVLGYHSFYKTEIETKNPYTMDIKKFDKQMKYLSVHNYKSLTLDEYYKWKVGKKELPKKSILITFDDGYESNYKYAFDVLKKYKLNGVVFLIGAYTESSKGNGTNNEYMSIKEVKKCKEKFPNIEFASHTYNMHDYGLSNKTVEYVQNDISNFNKMINSKYHAFPFGLSNDVMKKVYKDNNYKLAFGFGPAFKDFRKSSRSDDNYNIHRINIDGYMSDLEFKLRLKSPF